MVTRVDHWLSSKSSFFRAPYDQPLVEKASCRVPRGTWGGAAEEYAVLDASAVGLPSQLLQHARGISPAAALEARSRAARDSRCGCPQASNVLQKCTCSPSHRAWHRGCQMQARKRWYKQAAAALSCDEIPCLSRRNAPPARHRGGWKQAPRGCTLAAGPHDSEQPEADTGSKHCYATEERQEVAQGGREASSRPGPSPPSSTKADDAAWGCQTQRELSARPARQEERERYWQEWLNSLPPDQRELAIVRHPARRARPRGGAR
jgi:hypothetical protein